MKNICRIQILGNWWGLSEYALYRRDVPHILRIHNAEQLIIKMRFKYNSKNSNALSNELMIALWLLKSHYFGVENGVTYPRRRLRRIYIEAVCRPDHMAHPLSAISTRFKGIQNFTIGASSAECAVRSLSVLTANRLLGSTTVYFWIYIQSIFLFGYGRKGVEV